ncbi:hypothetical protein C8J27_11313 [Rhodobacter aestuarii]|uniref:Uncharacterized protein n=2 Tax=Rhodobacter aestuarii TaxID=453582 RepID=A0A1N7QBU8_9RHOB|nr:hypothetical protein [Rhodobacter aestuarii]PTV93648.1 hypothetical protein C8J27_11313 [Rhodobacter aestuarii]SIT20027.1 hypothetical protein SAMN05421580_11513 [Rhodobacter aestuarii]
MNMPNLTPETMTADERREAWFQRELIGYALAANSDYTANWDYGHELLELLASRFRVIELILGADEVAPHLFALLHGPDVEGETWREAFETYDPVLTPHWTGTKLIDNAGIYGLYGVTPKEVRFDERDGWLEELARHLEQFRQFAQPEPQGVIARIINLALSRRAIDTGVGEVDLQSLALFGGVTEGRIRNILSSNDGGLEKVGSRVTATSAAAWLKGRKEFFASIWPQPDETPPEAPSPDFADDVVFVPVAADGSHFHPGLARGGKFMVGAKGEEVQYASFDEALIALHKMATPRWRRPNEAGNWGIVSGRDWKRIERRQLMSMCAGV